MDYVCLALAAVGGVLVLLLLIAVVRTLLLPKKSTHYALSDDTARVDAYAEKLSRMVQVETVSRRGVAETEKFRAFHALLEELFPRTFAAAEKIEIDGNLMLRWKGQSDKAPILLMSHMDVVEAGEESAWRYPPFSGTIAEGKVWGRGAADTKASLMAFFEAIEELLADGYLPACDVYLASSCTEEVGGDGAPKLAAWLKANGVRLFMLCDEGGSIVQDPVVGVKGHFAAIGIFEKGYGDVKFTARSVGGHASAPARNTPIPRLAKFVARVEKRSPFKAAFSPAVNAMFGRIAPYCGNFGLRLVMANLWLFRPLLKKVMPLISAQAAAMLSTTIAFTMQSGSEGYNVLPAEATVCANMRFIPHQGTDESLAIITDLAAKYGIETEVVYRGVPSASLDLNGEAFAVTQKAVESVFPKVGVLPYVVTGATDARFYGEVCDSCVRFAPVNYGPEQMKGMHGLNENIEAGCLPAAVDYYKTIIRLQEKR
ncbi:MAG: M20/M25/M40 family metallo-hydrolase [Ruminococcaceae bacterium]|nr:M20/M25/M40 family metallo-hydrolase [Oscillospiraceae bacterium]